MRSSLFAFTAIGSLLLRANDIEYAAEAIARFAEDPSKANAADLSLAGVNAQRARDFLALLPSDIRLRKEQCDQARAWALGRASAPRMPTWRPVVTKGEADASGIDHATAETMVGLVVGARRSVRIFSPYLDPQGLDVLSLPIAAATRRGVAVVIGYRFRGNKGGAVQSLTALIGVEGVPQKLRTQVIGQDRSFPHLKFISADGLRAYIGSANLTWPALTSNAEVGALVEGRPVAVLERWFDALLDGGQEVSP